MAMGIQQQHQPSDAPMFPGDFVEYGAQYETNDRSSRDAGRNGRYRRPRSPSLDDDSRFTTGAASEQNPDSVLQDAVLAQAPHQQQRVVPTGQQMSGARGQTRAAGPRSGPPSMANASQNRRSYPQQPPPVQSQGLPPYAGGTDADDWSPASRGPASVAAATAAAAGGGYSRRRTERHARRQSSTSGGPPPGAVDAQMSGGASPRAGPPAESLDSPRAPQGPPQPSPQSQGLRPPSPPGGDEINRLQSPSISKSVLEPLQRKMLQYHNLMQEEQGHMTNLDEEIRALQERRRLAEQRFVDAKTKHDEYERQHLDVERALRGDYTPPHQQHQQQQPQPQASQQQHQMYNSSPPRTVQRPASSIMSYDDRPMSGRSSMQGKKGKFRISLFGR
ncbi:hypothetical protein Cob_v003386 [Colletotrichum orbiculare MAFF 240422]|uniref:Uncharacterized protein n=1 Tax=Colletotrichum orbiculare (strain 104-T / ATCC 96160 / CBS 514.97 / LARS 414 / MAFF 240422) TaxID=1213857 RepID=A0A484G0H0_COLOR|nr:hypothetical protein Cob_v003386 [Colletotrichum orbiculare MAFF 240422]